MTRLGRGASIRSGTAPHAALHRPREKSLETLRWVFLESTWALAGVLGIALFFLVVHWRRSGSVRPLLVGLGVAAALLIVQMVVVTPRERVAAVLHDVELDVLEGRTGRLARLLAPDFHALDMGPTEFVQFVRGRMEVIKVRALRQTDLKLVTATPSRIVADADYSASVVTSDFTGEFPSHWRVTFERAPDGWRIADVVALSPDWSVVQQAH